MNSRFGQDMATGLLFAAIGVAAASIGWHYAMGTPQKPGTGVLPMILSCCLIVTGIIVCARAMLRGDAAIGDIAWRPLVMTTLATVAFGLLIDRIGLIPTMAVSLTMCAAGISETRWGEYATFLSIMIGLGWFTFIWLLGMPIPSFAFPL